MPLSMASIASMNSYTVSTLVQQIIGRWRTLYNFSHNVSTRESSGEIFSRFAMISRPKCLHYTVSRVKGWISKTHL